MKRQSVFLACIVALASAALALAAALGTVLTLHFVLPDLLSDLLGGVGLSVAGILPLAAAVVLAISSRGDYPAQRRRLVLARLLLGLGILAIALAGLVTAFAVGFTLVDSPPFDRRGLEFPIALTNVGFYGALATDALALALTFLIRIHRSSVH